MNATSDDPFSRLDEVQVGATAMPSSGDLWRPIFPVPENAPKPSAIIAARFAPPGFTFSAGWHYRDASGQLLGSVARYDRLANGQPAAKQILPLSFCEGPDGRSEWRAKSLPAPRPLYGLDRLAARTEAPVIVTEGEKAADAAERRFPDHVAVTSSGGSNGARRADWSPLRGRQVIVWPDADEPGGRFAADVAELALAANVAGIATVAAPIGAPEGWDLADELPAGVDGKALRTLLRQATPIERDGPLPLFPPLAPARPYPVEALGPLATVASAIARKVQVPDAIAAQSVLAAASLAVEAHADVMLPFGQTRPLSLFLVTIAASGDRKSSADNEALWPVYRREKHLREQHAEDMTQWRIDTAAWNAERRKIEADNKIDFVERKVRLANLGAEPPKPLAPFLVTGDLTAEGLAKNWTDAHPALGVFTAEGGVFTGGHGMSDDNRLRTAAMLSEIWDGKPIKRVRAGDGVTILPGRRLALHVMIQPNAAIGFLGDTTLKDQGLLSRILVASPESLAGTRVYRETDPADDTAIRAYGARLLSILESLPRLADGSRNELAPEPLRIDPEAATLWRMFHDHVERQVAPDCGLDGVQDFAAKAAEHAARIAGVLTLYSDVKATEIGRSMMECGITLANFYIGEAARLHAARRTDPKLILADKLLRWLRGAGTITVPFRDVLQRGPGALRTKDKAEAAIGLLIAHGWVEEVTKRPRTIRLAEAA